MKVLVDPPKPDFARFNKQIVKTQTAGQLLNYYGDLIQRIEQAIKMSNVKKIPETVKDVPVFKNLVYNKTYSNIFNVKLNNIHSLKAEFDNGMVYLEKLTMSNRSRWLKKNFKDEIKMFASTYKEIAIKSYFDIKTSKLKYDIIFNFNGTNPSNESWFQQINGLSREKINKQELFDTLQQFINLTNSPDIKIISKAQLLDLIEESLKK